MTALSVPRPSALPKGIALMLVFLSLFFISPSLAHADGDAVQASTFIAKNDPNINSIVSKANKSVDTTILSYDAKTGVVSFSFSNYHKLTDQTRFMESALQATSKSGLGAQRKNKLYNFIAQQDGTVSAAITRLSTDASADFYTAAAWFRPFSGPFSTFLGVVCLILAALLGLSIVIDLSFIALPFFRSVATEKDSGIFGRIVSSDARVAMQMEDTQGKSAIMVWLRKRILTALILGIVLGYLVLGSIYDLLGWVITAVGIR